MSTITPVELSRRLSVDPGLRLIDVRSPAEYAEVHVEQARNVPLPTLQPKELFDSLALQKEESIYLLCHSGARAQKAASLFAQAGLGQAVVVEGGTQAWIAAELPVLRGERKAISLERQVRIAAGSLVLTGVLLSFIHPAFVAISAFVGAGLVFAGISDWCGMGLLLAKAPWNR